MFFYSNLAPVNTSLGIVEAEQMDPMNEAERKVYFPAMPSAVDHLNWASDST